jgi:hypothetical protein
VSYEIEYDVPRPKDDRRTSEMGQAFNELAQSPIGASMLLKDVSVGAIAGFRERTQRRFPGVKLAKRSVDGGFRIWRIA